MPVAAHQECRSPLCGNYAEHGGYCAAHQILRRGPVYARNMNPNNHRFQRLRHSFLVRHPLCNHCVVKPATVLDHIIPHKGDSNLFWRQSNWQGLCIECHGRKTLAESFGNYPPPTSDGAARHLVVLMGAPGSGKSTYAARYPHVIRAADYLGDADASLAQHAVANASPAPTERSLDAALGALAHHLQMNHEVVFDTTAANPTIREQAMHLVRTYRARSTLVLFTASVDVCCARQQSRSADAVPDADVRRIHQAIAAQRAQLAREGWMRILIVDTTGAAVGDAR